MSDQDQAPARAEESRRNPGKTHPVMRALGYAALVVVSAGLAGAICGGIALALAYRNLPDLGSLTDYRPKLPMRVYSVEGTLIGEFGDEQIGRAHV